MPASATRSSTLIDHLTPDAVYGAFPEEALDEGRDAVEQGRVSRPDLRPARADAVVVGADRRAHRARVAWIDDGFFSSCTCGARRCGHAAALGLLLLGEARLTEAEDEKPATSPREAERQRRASRGASELFEIRRRPGGKQGVLGEYEVSSPSSRAYRVTLRALDAAHNGCNCPDFAVYSNG